MKFQLGFAPLMIFFLFKGNIKLKANIKITFKIISRHEYLDYLGVLRLSFIDFSFLVFFFLFVCEK